MEIKGIAVTKTAVSPWHYKLGILFSNELITTFRFIIFSEI